MSYKSPWSAIGQTLLNLSNIGGNHLAQQQQQLAAQGESTKALVGQQAAQLEAALADPNYVWKDNERTAAEDYLTQARTLLAMDPTQVPGSHTEWMKRSQGGVRVPETVIKQGGAGQPMQAQTTPQPYQGGISGFLGNVNQGVMQAGQEREQFEQEAAQARQLQLMGKEQEYRVALGQMENRWGKARLEDEQLFSSGQASEQLDAGASWQRATSFQEQLRTIASNATPENKRAAQRIMKNAKAAGLLPGDLQIVQGEFEALGSGTAALNWKDRLTQSAQGQLTTEQLEQDLRLGEQQITLGGQQIVLGEYAKSDAEYLQGRRAIEDFLGDHTAMKSIIAEAVAAGDDKYTNDILNTLRGGGAVNPQMYEALSAAGITEENLAGQLEQVVDNAAWRERKDRLDKAETNAAFVKIQTDTSMDAIGLANAQSVFLDGVAKQMTPAELEAAAKDPNSQLGRLMAQGLITASDLKAAKRNANVYGIIRQDEVLAPRLERAMTSLEMLAAVPNDPAVAENALRSTLSTFVDAGVYSEETAEGIVSGYKNAWEYGRQTQDSDLATAEANRAYQAALTFAQTESLTATASETGWSEETKELLDAAQTAFDNTREDIKTQYPQCFSSDGGVFSGGECARAYQLAEENRLQREGSVRNLLGALAPQDTVAAMTDVLNTAETNVRSSPEFQGAPETAVATEISRRLVAQGFAPLPQEAFDQAAVLDEQAGTAQPQQPRTLARDATAVGRGLVGGAVGVLGAGHKAGARFERYVTGRDNRQPQPAQPAPTGAQPTASPAPTPTAADPTTSTAPPPGEASPLDVQRIQAHGMFRKLTQNLATMNTTDQRAAAAAIAADLGLSVSQVLVQAQVASQQPMPGYRGSR